MRKYFSALMLCMPCLVCCNKQETPDETYAVTITMIEPGDGEVYLNGDELHVEIQFENSDTIKNIAVLAVNETEGDTLYYLNTAVNTPAYYEIHEHFELSISDTSVYRVYAASWSNTDTARIFSEIHFSVNP